MRLAARSVRTATEASFLRRTLVLAVAALVLSGAGRAVVARDTTGANAFQVRPVLGAFLSADDDDLGGGLVAQILRCRSVQSGADDPSKCALVTGPVRPPEVFGGLYVLGRARLTAVHVADARAERAADLGPVVDVTLTRAGAARMNVLANRQYTRRPPRNAVAILVDGTMLSSSPFTGERFRGRTLRVTGVPSDAEAQRLARVIRTARPLR